MYDFEAKPVPKANDAGRKRWTFDGRASRSEYWWPVLLGILVNFIPFIGWIYGIAALVPGLCVAVRRLHDVGKSGWWLLFGLLPIIGAIILLYQFCQPSEPKANKYGPVPNVG